MLFSLLCSVLGSLALTAGLIVAGAPSDVHLMLLPVHMLWGMLCGVLFS